MLYCPHKTNLFGEKCCTVPIKPKNNLFESSRPTCQKDWFYWDSTALSASGPKIGFIGTIQHFLKPRGRKCCTVPKNQAFGKDYLENKKALELKQLFF